MDAQRQALFKAAGVSQRTGETEKTRQLCQQILALNPEQANELQALAILFANLGEPAQAIELLERAITKDPQIASYHYNLGVLYAESQQQENACRCYRNVLALQPDNAQALNNLGVLLQNTGQTQEAMDCYQKAIQIDPKQVNAYNNLGNICKEKNQYSQAIAYYQKAIATNPNYVQAYANMAAVYGKQRNFAKAIELFEKALAIAPQHADIHANMASILTDANQVTDAIKHLQIALRIKSNDPDLLGKYVTTLVRARKFTDAETKIQQLLKLAPQYPPSYLIAGMCYVQQTKFTQAEQMFKHALSLDSECANAHFYYSMVLLTKGHFSQGWQEFEWRWQKPDFTSQKRDFAQPLWDGKPLNGKTLLVHTEQGIGDSLQFIRLLNKVKAFGDSIILECEPVLETLFRRSFSLKQVVNKTQKLPKFDTHIPLLSLAKLFNITLETIPKDTPYLQADAELCAHWAEQFKQYSGCKIGIVWAGNPQHSNDYNRSMPFATIKPLLTVPNTHFFSLQKLLFGKESHKLPLYTQMIDLDPYLKDFDASAAIIENLDLVISVDTATAHLAGALGKPTWILLPFSPDWRWLLERDDSPWYPSAHLFRQTKPGDWATVIAKVVDSLRAL